MMHSTNQMVITAEEMARNIRVEHNDRLSRVILSISPCRSGTTAVLRIFGALGIESHLQPLKNILRWKLLGREMYWHAPLGLGGVIYVKETLGPFKRAEALFDPLEIMLAAGLPPEKLQVLIQGRTPLETWASWRKWWHGRTSVALFITAYRHTERIRERALQLAIPVTTLVYEAFRDNPPAQVVQGICRRLDVAYAPGAVEGWQALPHPGAPGSNIVIPEMPAKFVTPGIRQRAQTADRFQHFSRAREAARLDQKDVNAIKEAGLPAIYENWRQACERDLGLPGGSKNQEPCEAG